MTSGAILSTYQRTRVESVCERLGLESVAYLWRMDQTCVLEQLHGLGYVARIVKAAAMGLDERWLWEDVAGDETRRKLAGLERKWGVNVAGDGGEYETLVVSAPGWAGEIVVGEEERVVKKDAGAFWIEFTGGRVEGKVKTEVNIPAVGIWDTEFEEVLEEVKKLDIPAVEKPTTLEGITLPAPSVVKTSHTLQLLNFTSNAPTPEAQLTAIFTALKSTLETHNLTLASLAHIHLHLSSLSLFTPLNTLYKTYFPHPLPPSRITTSTPLPPHTHILLSATAALTRGPGLHVQSISYWAPCNIGPYSQGNCLGNGWIETAGMIPLIPASMDRVRGGVEEVVLGLQHVKRVWEALGARGVGAVCWVAEEGLVGVVMEVWKMAGRGGVVVVWAEGLPRGVGVEWEGIGKKAGEEEGGEWGIVFADEGEGGVEGVKGAEVVVFGACEGVQEGVRCVPSRGVWDAEGRRWNRAVAIRTGM